MKRNLAIGIVLLVVIAATIGAIILFGGAGSDEEDHDLKVGDYLKYQYTTSGGNATMWMNVTLANETGYEFTVVLIHDDGYTEHPDPWFFNKTSEVLWGVPQDDYKGLDENFTGVEELTTPMGVRSVNHYQNISETKDMDIYIGVESGILYRYFIDYGYAQSNIELVETNISWA